MNLTRLQEVLADEPSYRARQVKEAIFRELIDDWSKATTLPVVLRNALKDKCPIDVSAETLTSQDRQSTKALVTLEDGLRIETVLMCHKDERNTICVSSQVGCPLACSFCATGKLGFKRNLETLEIVTQVVFFARYLKELSQKVTNVVFMGMGEPFLNYDNVMGAIRILNDGEGFNLGARRFSISTVGIVEGIERLSREHLQVNLAVSLNAPEDALRSKIMPVDERYPINKILKAVDGYITRTRRRVMFEYILLKGVNDGDECARRLVKLVKGKLCFVNLIAYNPTGESEAPGPERIKRFREVLEIGGVAVTQRYRLGGQIEAACGQLAARPHVPRRSSAPGD